MSRWGVADKRNATAASRHVAILPCPPVVITMTSQGSTVIPCLRHGNGLAAIDWLCNAFGLEQHAVYADGDAVHHAPRTYGGGMVMPGPVGHAGQWGTLIVQPDAVGGGETQSCGVVVDDAGAHSAAARKPVRRT